VKLIDGLLVVVLLCMGWLTASIAYDIGVTAGRQAVEAVACEPTIVGLRKNGKEIPLTSAQRDSLANDLRVRVR